MLRTMMAALYLLSIPGPSAWAQVSRAVRVPAVSVSAPAVMPALSAPLGSLSAPALSALPPGSLRAAAAPLAAPLPSAALAAVPLAPAPAVPARLAALSVLPAASAAPERGPAALTAARGAAASAMEAAARPSSAAEDRARVDFADGAGRPAAGAEPVAASAPRALPSGLAPAPKPSSPRLAGYLSGTFGAQLASNALQVTMPLLFLKITGSAAAAAFAVTVGSAFDAAGTLVGGWLTDRVRAKPVLIGTTLARGAAVAALPVLALTGGLTLPAVAAAYLVECFSRGIADTARSTLPSELAGRDDGLLKRVLAKNQSFFEAGGVAGPFLAGALIAGMGGVTSAAALWLAPAAFAAVTLAYLTIPKMKTTEPYGEEVSLPSSPSGKGRLDPWMRWALAGTALLTMYPLKGLLPAVFATQVLRDPASAAWLVGLFGVGGFLGSLAYGRWNGGVGARAWLAAGAAGTAALAAAFLPGAFLPAALGVLLFAAANVAARLSLNAAIQTRAAPGAAGAAMGAARFTANLTGLGVRFLAGLAFTAAVAPLVSFWLVGGGVALAAGAQLFVAGRLSSPSAGPRLSAVHGRPGRLIVVEGLDGSGKSTQLERLKEHLEAQGLKVVTTSWNSSELASEAVKKAKKSETLNPRAFALMNAADLADRLEKTILPALDEGAIVLADRWFFTALARDAARGNDPKWLRRLYADAPRPDLTLYFRLPVDTAIGRVMARAEGKLGLSEDFEDEASAETARARRGLKYYEAGLDAGLSKDPVENFRLFQRKVTASYDGQAREFGFRVVDSSRDRDAITPDVTRAADAALGPVSSFKRADAKPARTTLFDKDPRGDADNIRRNYLHEKRGAHFYFRNMLLPMQERFAQLMDMSAMPRVFLHGSPHIDNYAKNQQGAAMVDFDRSKEGPYAWDLVRLMVSMSLRRKKDHPGLLDEDVLKQLKKGYLRGFRHPDRPFSEVRELKDVEPEAGEETMTAYLKAGKKWAKEMRANPLTVSDKDVVSLIGQYAKTQEPGFLDRYAIEEAGRGRGSMGFRGVYLVVLAPKDKRSGEDRLFLNIKEARKDPDTRWYTNPYPSEVERMHAAAELYAPGWTLRPGSAVLGGVEFDVRPLSPQNVKIKKMLTREQQMDFAYAVGTQLGRAHRLSLQDGTPAQFEKSFEEQFDGIVAAGLTIRDELVDAHARYLQRMKREGLEPHGDGDDE